MNERIGMLSMLEKTFTIFPGGERKERSRIALIEPDFYPFIEEVRNGFVDTISSLNLSEYSFIISNASTPNTSFEDRMDRLERSQVELMLSIGSQCIGEIHDVIRSAYRTVPVVYVDVKDPYQLGLVDRHGISTGPLTGITYQKGRQHERVNHLIHLLPDLRHVMIVCDPENKVENSKDDAREMALLLQQRGAHVEIAFMQQGDTLSIEQTLKSAPFDVMITLRDATVMANVPYLAELAQHYRVPLFTSDVESVMNGAAFGCGETGYELGAHAAHRAHLILEGGCEVELLGATPFQGAYSLWASSAAMQAQGVKLEGAVRDWLRIHGRFV